MKLDTIHNEDCLEGMKRIPDGSVDMVLCDLPYGTTRNSWDSVIALAPLWAQYQRVVKAAGAIVLTASQPFTSSLVVSGSSMFRYALVWAKSTPTGHLNAKKMPLRRHEDVLVFYRSLPTYNPIKSTGHTRKVSTAEHKRNCRKTSNYGDFKPTGYDSTERYPTSVLTFKSDRQVSSLHPTQKPVALFEYLVKTYTNPGEVVLDNCMGSGTTAVACVNTGRHYIGFETDKGYFEAAQKRVAAISGLCEGLL
jgi:site-specific DNA-methyltransferase (adenine-specific)